jgi:YHS domain-containing protein
VLRLLAFALLALLLYVLIRAVVASFVAGLRGAGRTRGAARALRNDLVKDPVCQTYVPRRTAIARTAGSMTYYFCGPACAAKFKAPS